MKKKFWDKSDVTTFWFRRPWLIKFQSSEIKDEYRVKQVLYINSFKKIFTGTQNGDISKGHDTVTNVK